MTACQHRGSILVGVVTRGRGAGPGQIVVRRVGELHGTIDVPGAKNSVLKLMAATILADGTYELTNVPADRRRDDHERAAGRDRRHAREAPAPGRLTHDQPRRPRRPSRRTSWSSGSGRRSTCSARCSPAAAGCGCRCPAATTSAPGRSTCTSPAWRRWAPTFKFSHGEVEATADRLHGADITFGFPSVGATENIVTAAVYADGVTTIDNAAREPEVVDLCEMLVAMGADIAGVGTSRLVVHGVERGSLRAGRPPHGARPHPGRHVPRRASPSPAAS